MGTVYFSVDIETDGVVAGRNNMLSLGAAALDMSTGKIVSRFKRNLEMMSDLRSDPDTMRWWKLYPDAYRAARKDARNPKAVMVEFVDWITQYSSDKSLIFAWKPVMDLAFLRYYVHRFHPNGTELCVRSIFGRQGFGLDQKTVLAIALGKRYRNTKMSSLPGYLRYDENEEEIPEHNHDASDDAREQAYIFWNATRMLGGDL